MILLHWDILSQLYRTPTEDADKSVVVQKEDGRKKRQKKSELTEKDYELMPVENIDWEKITPEERQQIREWAKAKETELFDTICDLEFRSFCMHYRKLFKTICKRFANHFYCAFRINWNTILEIMVFACLN